MSEPRPFALVKPAGVKATADEQALNREYVRGAVQDGRLVRPDEWQARLDGLTGRELQAARGQLRTLASGLPADVQAMVVSSADQEEADFQQLLRAAGQAPLPPAGSEVAASRPVAPVRAAASSTQLDPAAWDAVMTGPVHGRPALQGQEVAAMLDAEDAGKDPGWDPTPPWAR